MKKYLTNALQLIEATNQTEEEHTKIIVQTHVLAKNLATQLETRVRNTCAKEYGQNLVTQQCRDGESMGNFFFAMEIYLPWPLKNLLKTHTCNRFCGAIGLLALKSVLCSFSYTVKNGFGQYL